MTVDAQLERLGDSALLLRFGDCIDVTLNARVLQTADMLRDERPAWLQDVVPAYAALALFVDTAAISVPGDPLDVAERWLHARLAAPPAQRTTTNERCIDIVVDYGGDAGPDLVALAAHAGLTADEVVRRHTAPDYRVAMLGFAPGFPYLLGLDPALAMPRLATPRERVPAGSVAIGGAQTGLYPQAGPGGWRLIGRTDAVLFDPARDPPTVLQPGDRVRFVARSHR